MLPGSVARAKGMPAWKSMRRWRKYARAPEVALRATTASDIAVTDFVGRDGSSRARRGTRMNPPPAPTSVPKVPTPKPKMT